LITGIVSIRTCLVVARSSGALLESGKAVRVVRVYERVVLRFADDWSVRIVVAEIDVGLVLNDGIIPAIVDSKGDEVDLLPGYRTAFDGGILRLEVGRKF
jgi:hypothetical protein